MNIEGKGTLQSNFASLIISLPVHEYSMLHLHVDVLLKLLKRSLHITNQSKKVRLIDIKLFIYLLKFPFICK